MKARDALRRLAEVSESQWGMVTSAQANACGVTHVNLTRLTESGDLVRIAHGVYRAAGAPGGVHDELRAAWLASEPARLAWERLRDEPNKVVVSGESAAVLHGLGDFRAVRSEFTTPFRKQTQRPDVHYRSRALTRDDVTVREGLPVTSVERTIADLVEQCAQLDHVGDALRDAARQAQFDADRLTEMLGPLAKRNGHAKGDGSALLEELLEVAHIDLTSLSRQIAHMPQLRALVTRDHLAGLDPSTHFDDATLGSPLEAQTTTLMAITGTIGSTVLPGVSAIDRLAQSITEATAAFDSPALRALLEAQEKQIAAVSEALGKLAMPEAAALARIEEAITAADWTTFARVAHRDTDDEAVMEAP